MKQLLKNLGVNKTIITEGVYQLLNKDEISDIMSSIAEEARKNLSEDIEEFKRLTSESLENRIVESESKIQKSIDRMQSILNGFSIQSMGLKTSIDSLHSISRKDAKRWGETITDLQSKLESSHEKGSGKITESELRIREELSLSLKDIKSSIKRASHETEKSTFEYSKRYDTEVGKIYSRFEELDKLMKKMPKELYEFGYQLQVSNAGSLIGVTALLNFKSGFTVVPNGLGIDVSVVGGGSSIAVKTPSGAIDGVNTTFTVQFVPLWIVLNQETYFEGFGYTRIDGTIYIDPSITPVVGSVLCYVTNGVPVDTNDYLTDSNGAILTDSNGNPLTA